MTKYIFVCSMMIFAGLLASTITNNEVISERIYYEIINPPSPYADYIARYDANWFDEVSFVFARETDARIVDIQTGREFYLRRTFGGNHADVEPLTKEDAAIMYDIWGGWSWARRPVLVYVNGYIFPGSLTNFPHAGRDDAPALATVNNRSGGYGRGVNLDAVKGNGVDGHMCLHFAGSLLHGSPARSNPAHQDAVATARNYLRNR